MIVQGHIPAAFPPRQGDPKREVEHEKKKKKKEKKSHVRITVPEFRSHRFSSPAEGSNLNILRGR